jgi:hypothetical protein
MDAHRLRSVIDLIIAEHRRHVVYGKLARIQQTLEASAANPCAESDEQFRGALTDLLAALRATTVNDMVESDRRILVDIGGDRIAGNGLAERALAIANERPFLPARAKASFAKLAAEVENRIQALCATQGGLQELNVDPVRRGDDSWELGILLPKRLIGGDLERLWVELKEWNQILRGLLPLFTSVPPQVALRTHSSERFELSMPLDREGALALGVVVSRVYEMFREVQANRDRAADLEKRSYPSEIVSGLMGYEHQLVGKQMNAIREELTARHVRRGAGRPKEIVKLLDKGLRFLAIKIREGVEVEIAGPRAAAESSPAEAGHDAVTHHVRSALQAARQAMREAPSEQKPQGEPQAPRLPLSKIAEPDEGEKKAA